MLCRISFFGARRFPGGRDWSRYACRDHTFLGDHVAASRVVHGCTGCVRGFCGGEHFAGRSHTCAGGGSCIDAAPGSTTAPAPGTRHDADDPAGPASSATPAAGDRHDGGYARSLMTAATNVLGATRAMATDVTVHGVAHADAATQGAVHDALEQFHEVEATCTRFDPKSPLMQVNACPDRWHLVPATLFRAIKEAYRAHQRSKGRFDPRVLRDLVGLGYDGSLTFSSGGVEVAADPGALRAVSGPWRPLLPWWAASSSAARSRTGGSGRHRKGPCDPVGPRAARAPTWTSS